MDLIVDQIVDKTIAKSVVYELNAEIGCEDQFREKIRKFFHSEEKAREYLITKFNQYIPEALHNIVSHNNNVFKYRNEQFKSDTIINDLTKIDFLELHRKSNKEISYFLFDIDTHALQHHHSQDTTVSSFDYQIRITMTKFNYICIDSAYEYYLLRLEPIVFAD
jgi:hypothetical protein